MKLDTSTEVYYAAHPARDEGRTVILSGHMLDTVDNHNAVSALAVGQNPVFIVRNPEGEVCRVTADRLRKPKFGFGDVVVHSGVDTSHRYRVVGMEETVGGCVLCTLELEDRGQITTEYEGDLELAPVEEDDVTDESVSWKSFLADMTVAYATAHKGCIPPTSKIESWKSYWEYNLK